MSNKQYNINNFLIVVAILLAAACIRFTNLNVLPVFADESIYVRWSQVMRSEPSLRFLPLSDGKQPLFMWATIPLLKIFSDPLIAGRVLSGISGLASVLGVGVGAYLLFKNTRLALISSAIWAVIPYSVFFERLSLADAMLTMFILWTFNLLILAFEKSRLDFAMLAGFTLGFAYLTKSPAVFYNILLPILIILVPRNQLSKKYLLISAALFAATTIIALGMYNILRLGPEFHQIALRTADYVHPLSDVLPHPLDPLIPHLKDTLSFLFYLLTPVGLLFVFWGMYESHKDHVSKRLVLVVLSLVPILAMSFIAKAFTARYLFFTAPFLVMLMSHGLDHLGQKTQKHILTYLDDL